MIHVELFSSNDLGARHWEALPIDVAEQYRSRIEKLSHILKIGWGGGAGRTVNARDGVFC